MKNVEVSARRGAGPVWVLECSEYGAVSQTCRLDQAADEMREAISYLAAIDRFDININVVPILDPEIADLKRQVKEQNIAAETSKRRASQITRELIKRMRETGYSSRDIATVIGVPYRRIYDLAT